MKDTLCSYYTNSNDITSYMAKRLGVSSKDIILEPSAGEGIFIDEILATGKQVQVDALDIDENAIKTLKKKYEHNPYVHVRETDTLLDARLDEFCNPEIWLKNSDTLLDEQLDFFSTIGGHYDKVIGNPPYGAWQDYDKRAILKKKYPGQYVKETYSLFLLRCISVLKKGGRLSFIIPDTYMFLNLHSRLREIILTQTKIDEILIFPSKFFPGVSFGYSNLSIITLERADKDDALKNEFRIIQGFNSSSEFGSLFDNSVPSHLTTYVLKQQDIYNNAQHRFILANDNITTIISKSSHTLGEVANIVTGFYTGDNKRFIRALDDNVKGAKNYEKITPSLIFDCHSLNGIPNVTEGYVPYVKSASKTRYFRKSDEWFVRWDCDTIKYYNSNKKSRFQNSDFYFKTGVAIPMVKASVIRAFMLENRVFDQSIVGIFPKDLTKLYYILALMNSETVNDLIHTINPTANNSANYVKQIPYIEPSEANIREINNSVMQIKQHLLLDELDKCERIHNTINSMIKRIYQ